MAALKRIFRLSDIDKDGVLSYSELNEFQKVCFKLPLQQQELEGIKELVTGGCPEGVVDKGILLAGFLHLHKFFLQHARPEATWTALRRFGYDEDLSLREEYLHPQYNF